jgi:hypothetical protein
MQQADSASGQKPDRAQTRQDHEQAKESDLSVFELQELLKQAPPPQWRHHRHQALQDEHQAQGQQEGVKQDLLSGCRTARCAAHAFEELGTARIQHHDIAFAVEAGFVSFQAAVELGKLRISAK